jgi:hypothetical protein
MGGVPSFDPLAPKGLWMSSLAWVRASGDDLVPGQLFAPVWVVIVCSPQDE